MKTATHYTAMGSNKLTVLKEHDDGTVDLGNPEQPATVGSRGRFQCGTPETILVKKCPVSADAQPGHCVLDTPA